MLLVSDELKVDEMDCLLCLLVGHEEVRSLATVIAPCWMPILVKKPPHVEC